MAARPPVLPALTGLRFFAALPVVLFHILPRAGMSPEAAALADHGYVTVGLFFVLSGFILTYAHSGEGETLNRRSFYWARFARIYPVYALAMLIALPAYTALYPTFKLPAWEYPVDVAIRFGLVQAWHPSWVRHFNVPSWSLSCEAFFYLVFPFFLPVVFRMRPREVPRSIVMIAVLAAFAPAVFEWTYPGVGPSQDSYRALLIKFHPLVRLPEFLLGMLVGRYFVANEPRLKAWACDLIAFASIGIVLAACLSGVPYVLLHTGGLAAVYAVLIWALAHQRGIVARLLSWQPIVNLGDASYALYILHIPILGLLIAKQVPIRTVGDALFIVLLFIGGSIGVNRWFEKPIRGTVLRFFGDRVLRRKAINTETP